MGVGVVHGPGGDGMAKADDGMPKTGETKKNTEYTHTATVNVALQNHCLNFENAIFFLPKTLLFVLPAVALLYFVRGKPDNNG